MVHSLRGKNLNVCQVLAKESPTAKRGAGKRAFVTRAYMRSMIAAMPCPPPMHIVMSP